MAAIVLPDVLTVPTRDELIAQYLADVAFRAPNAAIAQGQLANLDAALDADMVSPLYGESVRQGEGVGLEAQTFEQLQDTADSKGLPRLLSAVGAVGFVIADAAVGGAFITLGTICQHPQTGAQYQCTLSALYLPGASVPVIGVTTGPSTDQAAGTALQWVTPPPGLGVNAVVFENSDGTGLSGGKDSETREELITRIRNANAFPAAAGNDASYQQLTMQTPGLGIEAVFTYPCAQGPGTTALVFLIRPSAPGGSRIPNAAQISLARAWVTGQMPKDDSVAWSTMTPSLNVVTYKIRWAQGIARWTDGVPWPPLPSDLNPYLVSYADSPGGTATPTVFALKTTTSDTLVAPQVGQTIGFWDQPTGLWYRKRIGVVTGANPYVITVDQTSGSSDTSFTPGDGQLASPWSDSLKLVSDTVVDYFDSLGPGEQLSVFFDDGYRQKRNPPSPQSWPYTITSKITLGAEELSAVESLILTSPVTPSVTPVGTVGVNSRLSQMITLGTFAL